MPGKDQIEKIVRRVTATVNLFLDNDGRISDENLARTLILQGYETSSSTVGRDLTGTYAATLFTDVFDKIQNLRKENKQLGAIKGGKNSVFNNDIVKDEDGKFKGSRKI